MHPPIQFQTTTLHPRNSINRSQLHCRFVLVALALACFAHLRTTQAAGGNPRYEGDAGNGNTVEGFQALFSNTTGAFNNALGYQTLYSNTTGSYNTATGLEALFGNTTGFY